MTQKFIIKGNLSSATTNYKQLILTNIHDITIVNIKYVL